MRKSGPTEVKFDTWTGRYAYLLISLLLLIVVHPFVRTQFLALLIADLSLLMILASGVYAASRRRLAFVVSLFLAIIAVLGRSVPSVTGTEMQTLYMISLASAGIFFLFNAVVVVGDVLRQRAVTVWTICGAISGYILIGLMFACAFMMIESLEPGAFSLPESSGAPGDTHDSQLLSFSYVTLTTVGYGDITPVSPGARGLCNIEALLGQIYLAVLVAGLVGINVSQKHAGKGE